MVREVTAVHPILVLVVLEKKTVRQILLWVALVGQTALITLLVGSKLTLMVQKGVQLDAVPDRMEEDDPVGEELAEELVAGASQEMGFLATTQQTDRLLVEPGAVGDHLKILQGII